MGPTQGELALTVRSTTDADMPELVQVLADAFVDEDQFRWLQPDDGARRGLTRAFFEGCARHLYPAHRGAMVAVADGVIAGCALWAAPGAWKARWWGQLRAAPAMLRAADLKAVRGFGDRGTRLTRALDTAHPTEPHWYLAALGIRPDWQGKGAGSLLVTTGLERCRRQGLPAYLECLDGRVGYYSRFGFRPIARIGVPAGSPPQTGMWSEASPAVPGGG